MKTVWKDALVILVPVVVHCIWIDLTCLYILTNFEREMEWSFTSRSAPSTWSTGHHKISAKKRIISKKSVKTSKTLYTLFDAKIFILFKACLFILTFHKGSHSKGLKQGLEHCMCIKEKQNISLQSFLDNLSWFYKPFWKVCMGP